MLVIKGQVFNVYTTKKGVTKDGKEFGGEAKVQLLAEVPAEDGTSKSELVDLKVKDPRPFALHRSHDVEVPVGVFSPARGQVVFFITGDPIFDPDISTSRTSDAA